MKRQVSSIGLAISRTRVDALGLTPRERGERVTSCAISEQLDWPAALALALCTLVDESHVRGRAVDIAVMPDVAPVRTVRVPPMTRAELRALVERAPERFFPAAGDAPVVTVHSAARQRPWRFKSSEYLVSAIPLVDIEAICDACRNAGLERRVIRAAAHVFIDVVHRKRTETKADAMAGVFVAWPSIQLVYASTQSVRLRAVPTSADVSRVLARLATHTGALVELKESDMESPAIVPYFVVADDLGSRSHLAHDLEERATHRWASDNDERSQGVSALSARFAGDSGRGEFVPPIERAAAERVMKRVTWWSAAATLALVLSAAITHMWFRDRDLAFLVRTRATLQARVLAATRQRARLEEEAGIVGAIDSVRRTSPSWLAVLANLAAVLPDDTSIRSMQAAGDSMVLEGTAGRAESVYAAMRSSPRVRSVVSAAPIRQDSTPEWGARESFSIVLRLAGTGLVEYADSARVDRARDRASRPLANPPR